MWEAGDHPGATLVNGPGLLSWNDLVTSDPAAASAFYEGLFGWSTQDVGGGYRVILNGERSNGGMVQQDGPGGLAAVLRARERRGRRGADPGARRAAVQRAGAGAGRDASRWSAIPQGAVFAVLSSDQFDD